MSDATTAPNPSVDAKAPLLTWRVGDVKITRIVELDAVGGSRFILPQATKEVIREIEWLQPHFADAEGRLKMSIHALVVEPHSTRAGFLFYDVSGLTHPLVGAKLLVRTLRDADGNELFYFEIPFSKYLQSKSGQMN